MVKLCCCHIQGNTDISMYAVTQTFNSSCKTYFSFKFAFWDFAFKDKETLWQVTEDLSFRALRSNSILNVWVSKRSNWWLFQAQDSINCIAIASTRNRIYPGHFRSHSPCPPRTHTDVEMARLPMRRRALVASILWKMLFKKLATSPRIFTYI